MQYPPTLIRAALIYAGYKSSNLPRVRSFRPEQIEAFVNAFVNAYRQHASLPSFIAKQVALSRPAVPAPVISHQDFEAKGLACLPTKQEALRRQQSELEDAHRRGALPFPPHKYARYHRVGIDIDTKPTENALEHKVEMVFKKYNVTYTRPEKGGDNPTKIATVDYWLPEFGIYVEVKYFPTPRLPVQIERCLPHPVIVLIGEESAKALDLMLGKMKEGKE